jgi:hypothetical protein
MNKTAGSATHRWFGLSRGQFFWAVAIRVIVAAIVGALVYVVTGSVLWLIVALFATRVVINGAANSSHDPTMATARLLLASNHAR